MIRVEPTERANDSTRSIGIKVMSDEGETLWEAATVFRSGSKPDKDATRKHLFALGKAEGCIPSDCTYKP